jgi:hypothetical protein
MGLLMAWVARGSNEKLEPGTIRYNTRLRVVAVLMLVIGAFHRLCSSSRFSQPKIARIHNRFRITWIWPVVRARNVLCLRSSHTGHLEHFSRWRGRRSIPWCAINGYEFSQPTSMHVLATTTYCKVRLSTMLLGVDQVVEKLGEQTSNDA